MLRLDEIHPVVSGNKLFKLRYFLDEAISSSHKTIITFGGAWSNHLAAAAYACEKTGLESMGFVRGEKPAAMSYTLRFCIQHRMKLEFLSRDLYKKIADSDFLDMLTEKYGEHTLIPEGGFAIQGSKGSQQIAHFVGQKYTHICCPVGTGTTFAGLINGCNDDAVVIGFSALKNLKDIADRLKKLNVDETKKLFFNCDYHFGGYAKKTDELISFMNNFYHHNKIPLDFVYTGKMMFGVIDLVDKNYFPAGSNILCIHTGGLQGNQSLSDGVLNF
ncbi:MAG: pyridoxal-phosphate dependent enzyme [Ginsengibacter sp.]